jgi:acetaldehyde dehydrogenase (acetylating)
METIYSLVFSSISSLIARTITYPLDTMKTRIQYSKSNKFYNTRNLFQGLGITLMFSVPASALYLTTYDKAKDFQSNSDSIVAHSIAAIIAESTSGGIESINKCCLLQWR